MKKIVISKLFLYRYRFIIGYILVGAAFIGLLFILPLIAQSGLSNDEIESATSSYALSYDAPLNGDVVNLPYRVLQKLSIMAFGLTPYAIKLPSIIMGLLLGILLILLLNRWFKNNVSLMASSFMILSTPFLFLAGHGTPLIMLVFWPTLLLWLGSKIQGEKRPKPMYCFVFAIMLLLSIFTPYMSYFAVFSIFFVLLQPHLRFVVKQLPKLPLIITGLVIVGGITVLLMNIINHPGTLMELLFYKDYDINNFLNNIVAGFAPVFAWWGAGDSLFLAPLIGLPTLSLALIGLFSTTKGFFASRNSIATLLIIFTVVITGFNPNAAIFFILPFAILIAHGLKYLLEKWYGLFPENPYARVAAIIPLSILFIMILVPSLWQYIYGYRYNPEVANRFTDTLMIIRKNLNEETLLVNENYDFYKILEKSTNVRVINELDGELPKNLASLYKIEEISSAQGAMEEDLRIDYGARYQLSRIITSSTRENSDIIYLYTEKGENNGTDYGSNEALEPAS